MGANKTENKMKSDNQKITDIILTIILIIVLAVIIFFSIKIIGSMLIEFFKTLLTKVSKLDAIILVALITGALSFISVIVSKVLEFKKTRKAYLSQKREEPYGKFIDMVYKIQRNTAKEDNTYTEEMMFEDISKFSKQLTLWGSRKVVKKWVEFRKNANQQADNVNNILILEQVMNEMRKDLGVKRMKKGDLLAFFVDDIDDFI